MHARDGESELTPLRGIQQTLLDHLVAGNRQVTDPSLALGVPAKDVENRELLLLTCLCRRRSTRGRHHRQYFQGARQAHEPPSPPSVYAPTRENRLTL